MTRPDMLRTPDERFADLVDFAFPPSYVDDLPGYDGLRAHYLDLGPRDAERTFLCLHGEPTWSYLYRKMIPVFLDSGARVVAPDLPGFGRSDKPQDDATYTFSFHREFLLRFARYAALRNITLVVQDWGGTLGLTLPLDPDFRAHLKRLIVMNTVLPIGEPLGPHYDEWRALVRSTPDPPVSEWMRDAAPQLSQAEAAAYDAPYPDVHYKTGPRMFPELAMVTPQMDGVQDARRALRFWAEQWDGETFMSIGASDPDAAPMDSLRATIRSCPPPMVLPEVGHFVPEQAGQQVARAALTAFGDITDDHHRPDHKGERNHEL